RLADAGAAEQTDLAAAQKGLNQVNDLNAGGEHLLFGRLFGEWRRVTMNRVVLVGNYFAELIHRFADDVQNAPECRVADRNGDGSAGINSPHAANDALGRLHCHAAAAPFAKMLFNLYNQVNRFGNLKAVTDDAQRLEDGRQRRFLKFHVNDRTDDLNYFALVCHSINLLLICRAYLS